MVIPNDWGNFSFEKDKKGTVFVGAVHSKSTSLNGKEFHGLPNMLIMGDK